jgi:hypothetical protein
MREPGEDSFNIHRLRTDRLVMDPPAIGTQGASLSGMKNTKRAFHSESFNSRRGIRRGWDRWGKLRATRRDAKNRAH